MAQFDQIGMHCRYIIAKFYGIAESTLDSLSCEQIKYSLEQSLEEQQESKGVEEQAVGERIELPTPPESPACGDSTCSYVEVEYEDILYVPAHPSTGEKTWYCVTKRGKQGLLEEKAHTDKAYVPGDPKQTLNYINKLGLLSTFSADSFARFMSRSDAADYRALLLQKEVLARKQYFKTEDDPIEYLLQVAKVFGLEWEAEYPSSNWAWKELNGRISGLLKVREQIDINAQKEKSNTEEETSKQNKPKFNPKLASLITRAIDKELTKLITDLENKAKKKAGNAKSDDGTYFVYMEELKYFSSEYEQKIQTYFREIQDVNHSDEALMLMRPKRVYNYYQRWQKRITRQISFDTISNNVAFLNNAGLVLKEQCLSLSELVGDIESASNTTLGPMALQKGLPRWSDERDLDAIDINNTNLINSVYEELDGKSGESGLSYVEDIINHTKYDWAYYPCLAMISLVDNTLKEHQSAVTQLFDKNFPLGSFTRKLTWIKNMALARIDMLKELAQRRAKQGLHALECVSRNIGSVPEEFTLIWDDKYQAKPKHYGGFKNEAELNNLQIVECAFLSDGQVFYARGPSWILPPPNHPQLIAQGCGHIKNITSKVNFAQPNGTTGSVSSVREALKAISVSAKLTSLYTLSKKFDSAFWTQNYHYQSGISHDGKEGAFNLDAGAQFLRFTGEAKGSLNVPMSQYEKGKGIKKSLGPNGSLSAQLTLAQAQLSFTAWFPTYKSNQDKVVVDDVKGWPITPYAKTSDKPVLTCGEIAIKIAGSVYGLAAATFQLGSDLVVGSSDLSRSKIGMKGRSVGALDSNVQRINAIDPGPKSNHYEKNLAQANSKNTNLSLAKVDAFAGVEAGGNLSAWVYWKPPSIGDKERQYCKLGGVDGSMSLSLGVGFTGDLKLTFQDGKFHFCAGGKVSKGIGFGGKVAITLDAHNIDAFIDTFLGVLKHYDYRPLDIFGEPGEDGRNLGFEALNIALTTAVLLGVSVVDVMLMPFSLWALYQDTMNKKEYAPFVALRIVTEEYEVKMRSWIVKLPPETLCNVFNTLIQHQTEEVGGLTPQFNNRRQAQAIVQVMEWLKSDDETRKGTSQPAVRQFKEALIRMTIDTETLGNKPYEWQAFQENWFKLARFVKRYGEAQFADIVTKFSLQSEYLCQSMVLTYRDSVQTTLKAIPTTPFSMMVDASMEKVQEYYAYPKSQIKVIGEGSVSTLSHGDKVAIPYVEGRDLPDTLPVMPWNINDVL